MRGEEEIDIESLWSELEAEERQIRKTEKKEEKREEQKPTRTDEGQIQREVKVEQPKQTVSQQVVEEKREVVQQSQQVETKVESPFIEEEVPSKEVYLIFGDKGVGKTTLAMSFPGEVLVLSFDRKSAIIKATRYNNDKRIHVFDVTKYMDYSDPQAMVKSAEYTFTKLNELLDNYTKYYPNPDWVVIDSAQIFQQICEWTMRARHGLEAFEGISNLNLWKERRMYIRQIHNKALNLANKGVIYTTYVEKDEVIIKGEVVTRRDAPAWIDVLIYETDYVLYAYVDESKHAYMVRVVSSKNDSKLPSGRTFDVTNKSLWQVIGVIP